MIHGKSRERPSGVAGRGFLLALASAGIAMWRSSPFLTQPPNSSYL